MINDGNLLNNVLASLQAAIQVYYPQLVITFTLVLGMLAVLQLAMPAIRAWASGDLSLFFADAAKVLLRIGLLYVVMGHIEWADDVFQGFIQIAQRVTGQSPQVLTPSGVLNAGFAMVEILSSAKGQGGWLHLIMDVEWAILVPIVFLAFLGAALVYLWALIDASWIVFSGPIFIAISGLEQTYDSVFDWAMKVLAISVKVLLLIMVIAVGMVLVQGWSAQLADNTAAITTNLYWLIMSVAQAVLFCLMVAFIPNHIMSLAGGGSSGASHGENLAANAPGSVASAAGSTAKGVAKAGQKALANFAEASHHKMIFKL
jgi:P-type conjugative transfer protein TrbL